jgi:type IV secretory pathway component VirB8
MRYNKVKNPQPKNQPFIRELWDFLWERKLWWLIPLIVMLLLVAILIIIAASTPVSPFIYALF